MEASTRKTHVRGKPTRQESKAQSEAHLLALSESMQAKSVKEFLLSQTKSLVLKLFQRTAQSKESQLESKALRGNRRNHWPDD